MPSLPISPEGRRARPPRPRDRRARVPRLTERRVVEDEIIVGFDLVGRPRGAKVQAIVIQALKKLTVLGAKPVAAHAARAPRSGAIMALALVRPIPPLTRDEMLLRLRQNAGAPFSFFELNAALSMTRRGNAPQVAPAAGDALLHQQWGLRKVGVDGAWKVAPPAGKTLVAIIDTGLRRPDGSVPEDLGAVEALADCQPDLPFPLSLPASVNNGIDVDGHGTLVAGTIAAVPGNGLGIASPIYPNWGVSLMPVKFFSPDYGPNIFAAAIAVLHAVSRGARVINASWHVAITGQVALSLQQMMDKAVEEGCVVVAAAGNAGTSNDEHPTFPANYAGVLAVAATTDDDRKASFSNYSPTKVGIAAPGHRIVSTGAYWTEPARYPSYSGTSAAAAFVSSAAALVCALNPGWTAPEVVQHLKDSADKLPALARVCESGNRLNIRRAVEGPLRIVAPAAGERLRRGRVTTIRWSIDYRSTKLKRVRIEASRDGGATWSVVANDVPNIGRRRWRPTVATAAGVLRITPLEGNFPALSKRFTVR